MKLSNDGFTLPELLVALVVTSIMTLVVGRYMIESLQQSTASGIRTQMLARAAQTLDLMSNDIRLSSNADQNNRWPDLYSPGGALNAYGWSSNNSNLVLASAAQDTGGGILFLDLKNYIPQKNNLIYFVNNQTLYKRTLAAPILNNKVKTSCPSASASTVCPADKALLHNVTTFTVSYLDNQNQVVTPTNARSIELRVVTSKTFYSKPITADYTTRMVFRND